MRPVVRIAGALICISLVAAASAVAAPRLHRTKLPAPPPLPTSLAVDEGEWVVRPSKTVVAAGEVSIRVYNRGMDDHDLTLVDATGATQQIFLAPGEQGSIRATLTPGVWKLYCSLFEGTPSSHEVLGMVALVRAKTDRTVR
ncbi:MAG: hypothetical protein JHC74_05765 [Thermoleophilia bacterium]|nr:hypothetical protein [Thermoleophilia bacterium]